MNMGKLIESDINHQGKLTALLLVMGLIQGCQGVPQAPTQPIRYDLGSTTLSPVQAASTPSPAHRSAVVLQSLTGTRMAEGSVGVHYRFAYAHDQQVQAYQQARWVQPPAALMEQALRDGLSHKHMVLRVDQVPVQSEVGQWPWILKTELEAFEHVFTSPTASVGHVKLRATLIQSTAQGEQLWGQRLLEANVPAKSSDVRGGVQALAQGTREVVDSLNAWMPASDK